jgi:hypothetical protein
MDRPAGPNSRPDVCFEVWPPVLQVDRGEDVAPEVAVVSQGLTLHSRGNPLLTHDGSGVAPGIVLFDVKSFGLSYVRHETRCPCFRRFVIF